MHNEKYLFFDFECLQNTGTHEVNWAICHDYHGNESIFNDINSFCNGILNEKYIETITWWELDIVFIHKFLMPNRKRAAFA